MEGIEFNTEKYKPLPYAQDNLKKSWAINLVMKLSGGRIKTDEQASYILVVVAIIFVILSIHNFTSSNDSAKRLSEEEIQKMSNAIEQQLQSNSVSNQ